MKKQNFLLLTMLSLFAFAIVFTGCKEDEPTEPAVTGEALFSYTSVGKTVTFVNESTITGTVTYAWTFGDGTASTASDPIHTYELKGEYTVTMTATDQNGKTYPVSTKVKVDKETRIALDDDSFDDWDAVTGDAYVVNVGDNSGAMVAAKFDYDANYVYAFFEFEGSIDDVFQNDFMLDTDYDSLTGMKSWLWPMDGADFLMEIAPFAGPDPQAVYGFNYIGTPGMDEWAWEEKQLPNDSFVMGTIKQDGANIKCEFGFDRVKVPGLDNDIISLGGFISDADWGEYAFAPDANSDEVRGKGHTLDMR